MNKDTLVRKHYDDDCCSHLSKKTKMKRERKKKLINLYSSNPSTMISNIAKGLSSKLSSIYLIPHFFTKCRFEMKKKKLK